ncbi:MAG: DUF2169 domain-containing protein [Pseudomonadales bacterium]|nr:DUF2169 domain-containing protein [Pseudomonadales bacterium]
MFEFNNNTPFVSEMTFMQDKSGRDILLVMVKATFSIAPKVTVCREQQPLVMVDEYEGEPGFSTLLKSTDLYPPRPGVDVTVLGHVHAPAGKQATQLDAGIAIANHVQRLRVFGDRVWQGGIPSRAEPFTQMPLTYGNSFGGIHHFDPDQPIGPESAVFLAENPAGKGFAGRRGVREMEGMPLPNIEDPGALICTIKDCPRPVGLGAIAPTWAPRVNYAGTYDDDWKTNRAPFLPLDFDERFFSVAPEGLMLPPGCIQGGELVQLFHLTPEAEVRFDIPICPLAVNVQFDFKTQSLPVLIEAITIEPDENRFQLLWKAQFPCERNSLRVPQVSVDFNRS